MGDEEESACSQGATAERLLHETLASVGRSILHLIRVSLKKSKNLAHVPLASSILSHLLMCGVSAAPVPGQHGRACVVGELVAEFQSLEEWCSWLEQSAARICDLLLGPQPGLAQLADCLDQAAGQLRAELEAQREADTELEVLRTLAA
jgi:hypothetical protein